MTPLRMFVNGQAMSGGSLNNALRDARFAGAARTAPDYRFFSVRDEFPGLHPVPEGGAAIAGEVYEVTYEVLRDLLLPREPPELELGVIRLEDGSGSFSMRMRATALDASGVVDITEHGGWHAYLATRF
ncbi:allophanate hydrolase-related protein [Streptomyces sp. NBC_01803]|uniref:allophanate hydrolase-related protein n=1 Tax=Streptomyces sp. NBC_01803 TaxID=2975946 RepID=UPI002DDBCB28|nr:gamma-glutamylcyclotransferase [Streptomyces sp. NBC_01803]WSA43294.1 gamma-glutamylcyclotransferase [Streptomyces sp. NBC_01803]